MRCILNNETDPAFNIAAEEYLLKNSRDVCFMLWRNQKAVIIGRNQNALAQINADRLEREGIPIVRRISGGGAVYHDMGNVNFTFIMPTGGRCAIDFSSFTRPIRSFLKHLGVAAIPDGRSDLIVNGMKISGNAQHIHRQRVLHHGTLLFDSDLEMLAAVLQAAPANYDDKAVPSTPCRVTNIRAHMPAPFSVSRFMDRLMAYIRQRYAGRTAILSAAERSAIAALADSKYKHWEWNFGDAPDYRFRKATRSPEGTVRACMHVQKGIIRALHLAGADVAAGKAAAVETGLNGCRHSRHAVKDRLSRIAFDARIKDACIGQLLDCLF
jgi:lipoate-protein ligase A